MPNGFLGYSTSGKKDGSSRKDRATSDGLSVGVNLTRRSSTMTLTGRLVEVALEDVLVEDQKSLQDLESVLVGGLLPDLEVKVLV